MVVTSSLFTLSHSVGRELVASGEARFNYWLAGLLKELVERASSVLAGPYSLPVSVNPAAPFAITPPVHVDPPPYKKPLNLTCPSYWKVEGQVRLNDALLPLKAAKIDDVLKRRELPLRALFTTVCLRVNSAGAGRDFCVTPLVERSCGVV
jgi:hypothetical protein